MDDKPTIIISEERSFEVSPIRQTMTFDTYKATLPKQKDIVKYLLGNLKSWYVFYGKVGTGKTHLSTAIARKLWEQNKRFTFRIVKFRDIGAYVRGDFTNELEAINGFVKPDLLIIEELGKGYNTEFEKNLLFDIVDKRVEYQRQTIIVTNMEQEAMFNFIGMPTADRLCEQAEFVPFTWDSHRQKKGG